MGGRCKLQGTIRPAIGHVPRQPEWATGLQGGGAPDVPICVVSPTAAAGLWRGRSASPPNGTSGAVDARSTPDGRGRGIQVVAVPAMWVLNGRNGVWRR